MAEPSLTRQPAAHRVARRLGLAGMRGARVYWGVAERLAAFPAPGLVRLCDDLPLALDPRDWSSRNSYMGLYERSEIRLLPRLIDAGATVVDVGVNVGYLAAVFARAVGPTGRVVGFEPSSRCLAVLGELQRLPELSSLEVHGVAVGDHDGEATLRGHTRANHSGGGSLREGMDVGDGEPVAVRSLDSALAELGVDRVSLLKIDVEGLEPDVLRGANGLLERDAVDNLLLEVTPDWGSIDFAVELVERLRSSHAAFIVDEAGHFRSRPTLVPTDGSDMEGTQLQFNLLLVRRSLVDRVADAVVVA